MNDQQPTTQQSGGQQPGNLAPLGDWLAERLEGVNSVEVEETESPKSGYSAETVIFSATLRGQESSTRKFVLRKETPAEPIYPAQSPSTEPEIALQYKVMKAITQATVTQAKSPAIPIASLYGYEPSSDILGAPFFVMDYVSGEVPVEEPNYTTSGFYFEASPSQRRQLILGGLETLAAIHQIDWQVAGLGWLVPDGASPTTARQLELWENAAQRTLAGRSHPLLERAFAWLWENLPEDSAPVLCWGDARLGNIIWQNFKPACVTDFEAVSIAPAEVDLGWWLMFDRWSHDNMATGDAGTRLGGEPTLEEQRDFYLEQSGLDIPHSTVAYHEIFAAARYSAIVINVMQRYADQGLLPPDSTYWLDNPVVDCLRDLLPD